MNSPLITSFQQKSLQKRKIVFDWSVRLPSVIRYQFELQGCSFYYWSSMNKNGKETTTRHSTTLIQSKVTLSEPNKIILTRLLLQYKWLKPQSKAFHLHHFQQTCKQFKIKNLKDVYINSLQSVNIQPHLLKKYYKMQEMLKEIKKIIGQRLKRDHFRPQIQSLLYKTIRHKYKKMARQKQINFLRQKINPKLVNYNKETESNNPKSKNKITFHKTQLKSPPKSKTKRSQQSCKTKLNNTKVEPMQTVDSQNEENYGLKCYHVKNKLSLHNANENGKSPERVKVKVNQYKQNHYYFNYSRPKHKKTNSNATPQKSIHTSRKVSSKESLYLRSEKAKTDGSKQKDRLKFNKKSKY